MYSTLPSFMQFSHVSWASKFRSGQKPSLLAFKTLSRLIPTSLTALARSHNAADIGGGPQPKGDRLAPRSGSRNEAHEPQDRLSLAATEASDGILQGDHCRHGSRH